MSLKERKAMQRKVYERLARVAGVFGSPARLVVLQILAQGPRSVESVAVMSGLSVANTSQHLQRMAREGLVHAEKQGVLRFYRVRAASVVAILEGIQDLAREVDPWLDEAEAMIGGSRVVDISIPALRREVSSGKCLLLDVRSETENAATPIPGAVSLPQADLRRRLKNLPKKKPIYIVCRGRYCPTATKAVLYLSRKGYKVFRLRHSPFQLIKGLK